MKKIHLKIILLLALTSNCTSSKKEVRIYSGDKSGTFFVISTKICDDFNRKAEVLDQNFICKTLPSKGSFENLYKIKENAANLGIIKAPEFYQQTTKIDYNFSKIKIIKKTHDEFLTILVNKNSKINSLKDLKNKRVNIGYVGSGNRILIENYFQKFQIKPKEIFDFGAAKSFSEMKNGKIDAWVYFIGHPNEGYKDVLLQGNFKIISLSNHEIKNFQSLAKIFKKDDLDLKNFYGVDGEIRTISSETFLAGDAGIDGEVVGLITQP